MKIIYKNHIYEAVYKNGQYDVDRIKRSNDYEYRIVDGITYRITKNSEIEEVGINVILPTEDNEFYPDHVDRYVKYIEEGGLIEPFPVEVSKLAYTLDNMLDFLDSNKEYEDEIYPEFRDTGVPGLRVYSLSNILTDRDEGEEFYDYRRLNPKANSVYNCFPYPDGPNEVEKKILPFLENVFAFFSENSEYTLINQNHRLEALKKLGKRVVLTRKN